MKQRQGETVARDDDRNRILASVSELDFVCASA
jgi:hypothetical protein